MSPQLLSDFKQRLCALLPGSPDLQSAIRSQLCQYLSPAAREVFSYSIAGFFRCITVDGGWQTIVSLYYPQKWALICQQEHLGCLDELCKLLHTLTGIREVYIRGVTDCHRCYLDAGKWIREEVY